MVQSTHTVLMTDFTIHLYRFMGPISQGKILAYNYFIYLGLEIDTQNKNVKIPQEKLNSLRSELQSKQRLL